MHSSTIIAPQAEAILEWLQHEMGYRPSTQYSSSDETLPSGDSMKRVCRGNMLPVWKFLLERVKSEKTVEKIRRNILVHGSPAVSSDPKEISLEPISKERAKDRETSGKDKDPFRTIGRDRRRPDVKSRGRPASGEFGKAKEVTEREREKATEESESKERALKEREAAELEVERLRHVLQRVRKELKGKMLELSREEGERQRLFQDKSNSRHKQVLLESYNERCEQVARIFVEYHRRLHQFVERARDVQRGQIGGTDAMSDPLRVDNEKDMIYATSMMGDQLADGQILIETVTERSVRKACESLAAHMIERIRSTFPAYDGDGGQQGMKVEEMRLAVDMDEEVIPEDARESALNLLNDPPQFMRAMATYTSRVVGIVRRETERMDIRADAERLRYKYENNKIIEDASIEMDENLFSHARGTGGSKVGLDVASKGTFRQLRERQKAHVQKFLGTEEALNLAAEARKSSEELIRHFHRAVNGADLAASISGRDVTQNTGSLWQFELEVWAKERELAGLKGSVATLTAEVQRLKKMCEERKAAEDALRKKWKRIEEFDARRTELESVYTALIHANLGAAASWEQHAKAAREQSANTFIPVCDSVQSKSSSAHDLVEREVAVFLRCPDNQLYMLPVSPQSLLDSVGVNGITAPEALAAAERHAELLVARASAGDPSAIPSMCRITAILQHTAGYDGPDAGLAAVVEAMHFCLHPCSSPANLLEDLSRAMAQVQTLRDLVGSGRSLLAAANHSKPEFDRSAVVSALTASDQEKIALERWLPELKAAVHEAQRCLEDCKRVRGLVDEWWEQPAATAVDWVTVDGQNVAAWLAHVKQLQTAFYDKQLL